MHTAGKIRKVDNERSIFFFREFSGPITILEEYLTALQKREMRLMSSVSPFTPFYWPLTKQRLTFSVSTSKETRQKCYGQFPMKKSTSK